MTTRRRAAATRILATLLGCEPTDRAVSTAMLALAITKARAQKRGHQRGGRKGKTTQREDAQTFASHIATIRRARPGLSDTAAIRLYLIEQGEAPTEKRIASQRRRLTRARGRAKKT